MIKTSVILLLTATIWTGAVAQKPLEIGSIAPAIEATDQHGKQFSLSESAELGPAVVVFYRGQWCGYCNRHMSAIQDSLQMLTDAGAIVIAVTPEQSEYIEKTERKSGAAFSILFDENHQIMDDWAVTFTMDEKTRKRYKGFGINVNKASGNEDFALPVPATYIVAKGGKIVGRHFDEAYKYRMPVKDMLEVLNKR
jgi:peroxiredoxin